MSTCACKEKLLKAREVNPKGSEGTVLGPRKAEIVCCTSQMKLWPSI